MTHEGKPIDYGEIEQGLVVSGEGMLLSRQDMGLEQLQDPAIEELIKLLSQPTRTLTHEASIDNMRKRQEAVDKFLLRGGAETLRLFFERVRKLEEREPIKLDLSMLEISGRLLSGLYLPGAKLEKLIFTESDISGSNIIAANLLEAVAPDATARGIIATGSTWTNAVVPGLDARGGRFVGCRFINTDMTGWKVDEDTNFAGARFIGAFLGGVDLQATNTVGAVFRGCRR